MVGECRIPGHITGLYIFAVVNLFGLLNFSLVGANVVVLHADTNHSIESYIDLPADFGPQLPDDGFTGYLIYVTPHDACTVVKPPPAPEVEGYPFIALIARGNCSFSKKVLNAQKANFSAAVVHNSWPSDGLIEMGGDWDSDQVKIPSVFVGYDDGIKMAHQYQYNASLRLNESYVIQLIEIGKDIDFSEYLVPMAIVVGCCLIFAIIFFVAKSIHSYVHRRRSRLSAKALRRIPTKKFKKGDHYDTCAICLEDYEEGEKLRVLPCDHTFHTKCVDPWLTKRKKTCPCCKRRVIPRSADTDSESDDSDAEAPNERTPLVRNQPSQSHAPSGHTRRSQGSSRTAEEQQEASTPEGEEQGAVGGVGISDQVMEVSEENQMEVERPTTSASTGTRSSTTAGATASASAKTSSKKRGKSSGKKRKSNAAGTRGSSSGENAASATKNTTGTAVTKTKATSGSAALASTKSATTSTNAAKISSSAASKSDDTSSESSQSISGVTSGSAAAAESSSSTPGGDSTGSTASAGATASAEPNISIDLGSDDDDDRGATPVRMEGSINVGFTSDEDETAVVGGRHTEKKKKKKRSNRVV